MKRRDRIASLTEAPSGLARWRARLRRIAVGAEVTVAWIVLDQQRQSSADDGGENPEHQIGVAPAEGLDQKGRQRRHHQRADADAAHGKPRGKAAAAHEPSLHRADRGHIGAADTEANAEPVGGIDLGQAARHACRGQPKSGQDHAGDREAAGAEPVGERAADDPEAEIEEAREREHQRHRAARGAEIPLQRFDEGAERVGAAEADKGHRERGRHHEPAIEDARDGQALRRYSSTASVCNLSGCS